MNDIVKTEKKPKYRFKKGDKVRPLQVKTWGYVCGIPDPYSLGEESYVVAQDSEPVDLSEPEKHHWWLRLEKFSGIKFLAADFQKCGA